MCAPSSRHSISRSLGLASAHRDPSRSISATAWAPHGLGGNRTNTSCARLAHHQGTQASFERGASITGRPGPGINNKIPQTKRHHRAQVVRKARKNEWSRAGKGLSPNQEQQCRHTEQEAKKGRSQANNHHGPSPVRVGLWCLYVVSMLYLSRSGFCTVTRPKSSVCSLRFWQRWVTWLAAFLE